MMAKDKKVDNELVNHKIFKGDRPSLSFLFEELNPYTLGQLLAIYEHRTAVEGFMWEINSFDQFGVELGKSLGTTMRKFLKENKDNKEPKFEGFTFNTSTQGLLTKYLGAKK